MKTDDYCSQCDHKDACKEVYAKVGQYDGPSVARDVLIALAMPIAVFIAGLAASQWFLDTYLDEKALIMASFACGVLSAVGYAAGIRLIRQRHVKKSGHDGCSQGGLPAGGDSA